MHLSALPHQRADAARSSYSSLVLEQDLLQFSEGPMGTTCAFPALMILQVFSTVSVGH